MPTTETRLRRLVWPAREGFRSRHRRSRQLATLAPSDVNDWPSSGNPFERIASRRTDELLWVGLDLDTLKDPTDDERFLMDQLVNHPADWGAKPFGIGGDGARWTPLPILEVQRRPDSDDALVVVRWSDREHSSAALTRLAGIAGWARQRLPRGSRERAQQALALHEMGAHIVVTKEPGILRKREDEPVRAFNLVSPAEACVLLGGWARAAGFGATFAHFDKADSMYYWALARSLAPASWTSFAAWVYGEREFPRGRLLVDLAQSVLTRLTYLVETLDAMASDWQRDVSNDTIDRLAGRLDDVLLRVWAIQDNLALLIGEWFQIELPIRKEWSLRNPDWRAAVKTTGEPGKRLLARLQIPLRTLKASEGPRHHAIHRESLGGLWYKAGSRDEPKVRLPADVGKSVVNGLHNAGQRPESWGVGPEIAPDPGGEYPGGVLLDPFVFAVRLTASVAEVANIVFATLDPANDGRLPAELRLKALAAPSDPWFRPDAGWEMLLTGPLAGLTPWISPPGRTATDH